MGDRSVIPEAGTSRRPCQYVRGGHCLSHGAGAIELFRGGYEWKKGRGGRMVKRYKKDYYYVCDLNGRGRKLRQTRISFNKQKGEKQADEVGYNFDEFLTSSEGQHGEVVDHGEMTNEKEVLDEKC